MQLNPELAQRIQRMEEACDAKRAAAAAAQTDEERFQILRKHIEYFFPAEDPKEKITV